MIERKRELRKQLISQRSQLSEEVISRASFQITSLLLDEPLQNIDENQTIMCYIPTKGEVDIYPLINELLNKGIQVVVPRTYPESKTMDPVPITDVNADLQPGSYGIYEPKESLAALADYSTITKVIVPGVAYDKSGYRLGFGGGYYDRFIESLSGDVEFIAVAYDFQVFPEIPKDPWDRPVDILVTENSIMYFN